ncbi:MAG TPA: non-heme iron oxygenase ferredoxin subunit [Candidatus Krumholzibacteria bacterium]|nr:non-heme iron oxygenase ferredoxin subunit [Candidatus Krumholzibacteria bacterium]
MRVKVCHKGDVGHGAMKAVEPNGVPVLIARVGERFFAVSDICSHARSRLSDGYLHEDACTVECPTHNAIFSLETGDALEFPADEPIPTYEVELEGNDLYINLPDD